MKVLMVFVILFVAETLAQRFPYMPYEMPPCPNLCYTQWFDRDNPSGNGDYETLLHLRTEYPGLICDDPYAIEVQTLSGQNASTTGQVIAYSDTVNGFACVNSQQVKGQCLDYKVRFVCPCPDWLPAEDTSIPEQ